MSNASSAWEGTVGIALRDTQWITLGPNLTPSLYVALTGKVEKHAGDVAFAHAQRFFLFELKGGKADIKTEWMKRVQVIGKDNKIVSERKIKHAHKFVLELAKKWVRHRDEASGADLVRSLKGHHFVYWRDEAVADYDCTSGLVVEPYLLATLEKLCTQANANSTFHKEEQKEIPYDELWKGVADRAYLGCSGRDENSNVQNFFANSFPISYLFAGRAHIGEKSSEGSIFHELGLIADDFREYVVGLMKDVKSGEDDVNAVVFGTSGFNRSFHRLRDIADVFASPTPALSNRPSTGAAPRLTP